MESGYTKDIVSLNCCKDCILKLVSIPELWLKMYLIVKCNSHYANDEHEIFYVNFLFNILLKVWENTLK